MSIIFPKRIFDTVRKVTAGQLVFCLTFPAKSEQWHKKTEKISVTDKQNRANNQENLMNF